MITLMRIGRRETRRRLTGLTLPTVFGTGGGGANWTVEESDVALAQSVLQYLEDRRVLYDPYDAEIAHACVMSVREIREHLRSLIDRCQSAELRNSLRAIQAACRQFLTDADVVGGRYGPHINITGGGADSWMFNQALGAFRARVGTSIAVLVETFDVDVDEHLAKILPPVVDDEPDS